MRRTADDFCLPTSNSRTKQMAWQAGSLITLRINSIWLTAAAYDMMSSSPVPILHSARSRQRWKAAGSCHRHCVSRSWRKLRRLHVPTRDSVPDAADHSHSSHYPYARPTKPADGRIIGGSDFTRPDNSGARRPTKTRLDARPVAHVVAQPRWSG